MSRIYLDDNLASPGDVGGVMQKAVLSPPPPPPHPGDQDTKDDNQWSPSLAPSTPGAGTGGHCAPRPGLSPGKTLILLTYSTLE